MTSSLVGSEMCIRDRISLTRRMPIFMRSHSLLCSSEELNTVWGIEEKDPCLLYTSDAADDM
eukprot:11455035-Prorocentrum_lima.AAC.1